MPEQMTNKQRVEALKKRELPDRVPIYPSGTGFAALHSNINIADGYNNPAASFAAQKKVAQDYDWVFMPKMGYASFGAWEFGGSIKWPGGEFSQAPSIVHHAVEKPEDVSGLKIPEIPKTGILPMVKEFNDLAMQDPDKIAPWAVVIQMEGTLSVAANMVGAGNFNRWAIKKKDLLHQVMRITTDFQKQLAEYWYGLYGADDIITWGGDPSSSNQMISPKTFREFGMPYVKEVHEKILEQGAKHIFKHLCGDQNLNLEAWTEVPMGDPGFLSFGHEVDLDKAAEYFPRDVIIGNLEPAIIVTATPQEVYDATKAIVEKGKKCPGGFMFGPGCEMPPMSPPENVRAMVKAVQDFGYY